MPKQLTAAFVRTVNTPGKYNDEHGLILRVIRSKKKQLISKSWVQRASSSRAGGANLDWVHFRE